MSWERELQELAARLRAVTVEVATGGTSAGSGVIWDGNGLVLTNAHVATRPDLVVRLADGRTLPARVVLRDPQRDLAALDVGVRGLPAATIGDERALRPGELVLAMGNPLGVPGALAVGIVHGGPARGWRGTQWIRADIRLAPGNSGGPLADAQGRVVGLNAMVVGGLGYAVPSGVVTRFLRGEGSRAA
ncbi:MAG TPA: trypsin-like peptidase domain-containing protein [Gemmatimonadales bacterium]|nr:trypsin-like peptidase domain-containing protein [Gemmatimonadales bacterium]